MMVRSSQVNGGIVEAPSASSSSSNTTGTATMERSKKKVEWSNNLAISAEMAPENRSPMWDSETDHLLSYFLGDSNQNGVPSPPNQFNNNRNSASSTHTTGNASGPSSTITTSKPTIPVYSSQSNVSGAYGNHNNNKGPEGDDDDDDDGGHIPPPTPAIHFYHQSKSKSSSNSHHPPAHHGFSSAQALLPPSSSSNNPVLTMKESLVAGPPASEATAMEGASPISPAVFIGAGHEPLMLPPSPNQPTHQSTNSNDPNKLSHLQWLQHINAVAKEASKPGSIPHQPPQTSMPTAPHPITQPPAPVIALTPGHSSHPVQAVAPAIINPVGLHPIAMPMPPYAAIGSPMFYSHISQIQQGSQGESEEKRAKRLERNRESARKSRRRKKERLSHLEEKVAGLHAEIETERRKQINAMDHALLQFQKIRIAQFQNDLEEDQNENTDWNSRLVELVAMTGPNCPVRKAVVEFQYTTLKQNILPRYQKLLLWMTLQEEQYFLTGKEVHAQREGKQALRVTTGKISSKQVGDELTNGRKLEDGTLEPPPVPPEGGEKGNQTARITDAPRMWPLMCFELSVSVDQEERFLQAHKRVRELESLHRNRSQIAAATRMASNLKEAVLYQSHCAARRSEETFSRILTPKQVVVYRNWLASNQIRCRESLERRRLESMKMVPPATSENANLLEICKKLEEVLKISKKQVN